MWFRHKTIIIAQYLLGIVSLPWILSSDLSHHDIKPKDEGCTENLGPLPRQPPSRGSARGRRGEAPDLGRPIPRAIHHSPLSPSPAGRRPSWESAAPDGSRHARHRPRAAFQPPPPGGSARLPAFPRAAAEPGRAARRARRSAGAAGRARAATARPLSRCPSRARRRAGPGGWAGGATAQSGNRCAPPPAASPRRPPSRGRVLCAGRPRLLCDRLQTLGAGAPPPLRPGLQMAPARLCASRRSPGPGTSGGRRTRAASRRCRRPVPEPAAP